MLSGKWRAQSTYTSTPSPCEKSSLAVYYFSKLGINCSVIGFPYESIPLEGNYCFTLKGWIRGYTRENLMRMGISYFSS